MSPTKIALIVFACVFGGALLGMFLRVLTPEHHRRQDSHDIIKLGMGLIATMAALVLGLVISAAKTSYDTQNDAVKHSAAKILLLDRMLASYGPETKEMRDLLRRIVAYRFEEIWPEDCSPPTGLQGPVPNSQAFMAGILQLSPKNDAQRWLQSRALEIGSDIMETRWLILSALGSSIPLPFLVVVVFWLTIIFGSFGLFAPRNVTVVAVLFLCALSVAGSIFLVLEMDHPFQGLIKISSAPLRYTLALLGQ